MTHSLLSTSVRLRLPMTVEGFEGLVTALAGFLLGMIMGEKALMESELLRRGRRLAGHALTDIGWSSVTAAAE